MLELVSRSPQSLNLAYMYDFRRNHGGSIYFHRVGFVNFVNFVNFVKFLNLVKKKV